VVVRQEIAFPLQEREVLILTVLPIDVGMPDTADQIDVIDIFSHLHLIRIHKTIGYALSLLTRRWAPYVSGGL
jgi:hypothetical protein